MQAEKASKLPNPCLSRRWHSRVVARARTRHTLDGGVSWCCTSLSDFFLHFQHHRRPGGGTSRTVLRACSADAAKSNRSSNRSSSKGSSRGVSAVHVRCLGRPAGGTIWPLHSR
ncbi:unnamed protein product [Ectocarpus sp. 8 AP-2014]